MLAVDGAAHARLRRLVGTAFTRARVEAFTPRIEALTTGLLDRLAGNEPDAVIDLIEEFAYPLPLVVIFELLGVPEARRERVHRLVESILAAPFGGENEFPATLAEYVDLLRAVVADKRAENGEDLLSALIAARDGGDRLTEDELTSMIYALIAAGHETTANLIGNGIRVLLRHPECLATWRAAPAISDSAVEELLRFDSPLHTALPLLAAGDLEIKGSAVHAGDTVLVALMAANHDHACVAEPDRLDLTRAPNHHLAFGHGAHHCLGATLARVEGRIAIGALIVRFPDLALADPPQGLRTRPNPLINGLDSLPVRLREPRGRRDAIMAASTSRD
jgi:cytochrome P450